MTEKQKEKERKTKEGAKSENEKSGNVETWLGSLHSSTPATTGGFYLSKHPQKPQKQHPIPGTITHLFRQS